MELKTTEEFVRKAHSAACSTWKQIIEKEFPELFELVVGRWYKSCTGMLFQFAGKYSRSNDSGSYGFDPKGFWCENLGVALDGLHTYREATPEEVESALITEAKKRGYKAGVTCVFGAAKHERTICTNEIKWDPKWLDKGALCMGMNVIFTNGEWTKILPEEKTVITHEKALKIIAKKLKVSPENIVIE